MSQDRGSVVQGCTLPSYQSTLYQRQHRLDHRHHHHDHRQHRHDHRQHRLDHPDHHHYHPLEGCPAASSSCLSSPCSHGGVCRFVATINLIHNCDCIIIIFITNRHYQLFTTSPALLSIPSPSPSHQSPNAQLRRPGWNRHTCDCGLTSYQVIFQNCKIVKLWADIIPGKSLTLTALLGNLHRTWGGRYLGFLIE